MFNWIFYDSINSNIVRPVIIFYCMHVYKINYWRKWQTLLVIIRLRNWQNCIAFKLISKKCHFITDVNCPNHTDLAWVTLLKLFQSICDINPWHTDVDYSQHSMFSLAPIWSVVESKICFHSWNSDVCWGLNFTNNTNFHSLEVVDRGSETQLQVSENLNWIAQWYKG